MNAFETELLTFLLAGDQRELAVLRGQLEGLDIKSRESTPNGFAVRLRVLPDVTRVKPLSDFQLGDVFAELEGLAHGAGFVLFVRRGALDVLEGYTHEEPWPETPGLKRLYYVHHPRLGDPAFVETPTRDLEQLFPKKG